MPGKLTRLVIREARRVLFAAAIRSARPPPNITVDEWADRRRYLSPEASAEHGPWSNSRSPHLILPMMYCSPNNRTNTVVLEVSSQTGKTELLLNVIGFYADVDPGPILVIQPNVSPMGEAFSKDRVAPMFRDTPALRSLIRQTNVRTSDQTILHKKFPGGHLTIGGANSPAGLASRPIRILLGDEVNRWSVTKEGSALLLARKRLQTFAHIGRAKEVLVSSPTFDDVGITLERKRCQRFYTRQLVCDECGATTEPELNNFTSLGQYICPACQHIHGPETEDRLKLTARWVRVKDEGDQSVAFRMSQWTSPFAKWNATLGEWTAAEGEAEQQVVTNTVFAKCWEGESDKIESHVLESRTEAFTDTLPARVRFLTMAMDVQGDRGEIEVVAWGPNWEHWSWVYDILPGEPEGTELWEQATDWWNSEWDHESGVVLRPLVFCIDASYFSKHVYAYVKHMQTHGIVPIKGMTGAGRDPVNQDLRQRRRRMARRMLAGGPPEMLGVDELKAMVYRSLSRPVVPDTPCGHHPNTRSTEYFNQLTAERRVAVPGTRGLRTTRVWVQHYPANEALDVRAYNFAAALLTELDPNTCPVQAATHATGNVRPPERVQNTTTAKDMQAAIGVEQSARKPVPAPDSIAPSRRKTKRRSRGGFTDEDWFS